MMRIVIDMQGAQTASRYRGIGRYTLSLAKAMVRNNGKHEIILALNGLFPESIDSVYEEFEHLLPPENIKIWHAVGPTRELDPANQVRRGTGELLREAFLANLDPDVVLITSLFEGWGDDALGSIGRLDNNIATAVILYDLIPLLNPDSHFRSNVQLQDYYHRKIASIKRSHLLLAISDSARKEALSGLRYDSESVVNISGACDEFFKSSDIAKKAKRQIWRKLGINKPFVMYTGGADERKNLHRLILAYAQLPAKVRRRHHLVFAGHMPDDSIRTYQDIARRSGMTDGELIIAGYVEDTDLLIMYNTCALFVFPSLHEGLGIPPLEAMACGAAVIGANATSLPEVLGLHEAMFDPTSVAEIAAKINKGLTDKEFHARLVRHGAAQYSKFSWDHSARKALAALERFDHQTTRRTSPLLNVEATTVFAPRKLKILVTKLDHFGDFILAIPALTKLRARYPHASIDVVVGSWNLPLAEKLGFFNQIYTFDFFHKRSSESPAGYEEEMLGKLLKKLERYDIALDLRRQAETRFFLLRVDADIKAAYETHNPELDRQLHVSVRGYPDIPFKSTPLNETSISLQMIALIDALPTNPNDYLVYPPICNGVLPEKGTVAIFPKAGGIAKEWGADRFVAYVDLLSNEPNICVINVYLAGEDEVAEFDFKASSKLCLHVGLKLEQLTASLGTNVLCVANNSGGAHLASYIGVPVLGIYAGIEMAAEWAPQFTNGYVIHRAPPCSPCHIGTTADCPYGMFCVSEITVMDVYGMTLGMLGYKNKEAARGTGQPASIEVHLQKNTDSIVKQLVKSLGTVLNETSAEDVLELARVIAKNHPTYSFFPVLGSVVPGVIIDYQSALIDFKGFSHIEPNFRWTEGNLSEMHFDCPAGIQPTGTIKLNFDTLGEQRIVATFNGRQVFEGVCSGDTELAIDVNNLCSSGNNLVLELPGARMPPTHDKRLLALAFRTLSIVNVDSSSIQNVAATSTENQSITPRAHLYLDISELVQRDAKTGIQRVVRAIMHELMCNPPAGYDVELVYASQGERGYRCARRFTKDYLGLPDGQVQDDLIEARSGDVFLGLDLNPHTVAQQGGWIKTARVAGAKVYFVVYDMLPVFQPDFFPDGAYEAHAAWLNVVAQADGALCISRAVAQELVDWLGTFGPERSRPLKIGWFHLGADISQSFPSRGLPSNAAQILTVLSVRPTFLSVSTLEPRKGQLQTLLAFDHLWLNGVDVNLVFVGKQGWMVEALIEKLCHNPEFNRRLFWLDGISDEYLEQIYTVSSCLIAASEGEGFGLPLVEAAKHGIPIIARDIPVFREVAGNCALYFSGTEASALTAVVNTWLDLSNVGKIPDSSGIVWLSWKESGQRLVDVVCKNQWQGEWGCEVAR